MLLGRSTLAVVTVFSVGCGGGAVSHPQAPSIPAPLASGGADAGAAAPDISPVPEPEGLVLAGKIRNLHETLATLSAWSKQDLTPSDILAHAIGGDAASFVDVDAPSDIGVVANPTQFQLRPRVAWSLGLRDPGADGAKLSDRFKVLPSDHGIRLLQSLSGAKNDGEGDSSPELGACELAPASGSAKTRLVCASDADALSTIGPWLTRTAPLSVASADAVVNLRLRPLLPLMLMGRAFVTTFIHSELDRRSDSVPLVKELGGLFFEDLADFALDLDTTTIELSTADEKITLSSTQKLSGHQSRISRLLSSHSERTGPAPAVFWKLPADANAAMFERGIDESDLGSWRAALVDAIVKSLGDNAVKDTERKAIADILGKLFISASVTWASGLDDDVLSAALSARKNPSTGRHNSQTGDGLTEIDGAKFGWQMGSIEAPITKVVTDLSSVEADLDRIASALAVGNSAASIGGQKLRCGPANARCFSASRTLASHVPVMRSAALPTGVQWPASAAHRILAMPDDNGSARRVAGHGPPLHILVVPEAGRTWFAIGGDLSHLAARMEKVLTGSGDNLGSRPDLASFKSDVGAGGFVSLRMLAGWFGDQIAVLPDKGRSPILFSSTARPGSDSVAVLTLRVPRAVVDDIAREGGSDLGR